MPRRESLRSVIEQFKELVEQLNEYRLRVGLPRRYRESRFGGGGSQDESQTQSPNFDEYDP